jgi:hypothetical protein
MRSTTYYFSISTARADALFASALQRSEEPSAAQVQQAIAAAIRAFGARGCAARVAQAYGEHPETAVPRMRWARAVVEGHQDGREGARAVIGGRGRRGRGPGMPVAGGQVFRGPRPLAHRLMLSSTGRPGCRPGR